MQIFQEVSSVQPASINSATGLITNKRSIESNVLVDDGAIVVLGGLLQDEYAGNQEKVPVLGDMPVLGNLFRTETRSRKKTNLMVFLRPVVVRDAVQSDALVARPLRPDARQAGDCTAAPAAWWSRSTPRRCSRRCRRCPPQPPAAAAARCRPCRSARSPLRPPSRSAAPPGQ